MSAVVKFHIHGGGHRSADEGLADYFNTWEFKGSCNKIITATS